MAFGGVYAFPWRWRGSRPTSPATIRDGLVRAPRRAATMQARAVVGAAARELFEEAGVLLAGDDPTGDRTVGDVSDGRLGGGPGRGAGAAS